MRVRSGARVHPTGPIDLGPVHSPNGRARGTTSGPGSARCDAEHLGRAKQLGVLVVNAEGLIDSHDSGIRWRFDDVPDATHDDIAKVGVRFEIPIAGSQSVKLPVSVIWANHEDVLTESDSVFAHIGFTVDFETALKKSK